MARPTKDKASKREQASLTLDQETMSRIKEDAKRKGVSRSKLVDDILSSSYKEEEDADSSKPTIIAVMSYKGGVAKTTTSSCLAVCLAQMGNKVLLIDLDGQGNASQYFHVYDPRSEMACIADVLYKSSSNSDKMTLDEVMRPTDYEDVYVVPSNFRFADADARMKSESQAGIDTRLRYAIEDMKENFNFIIIDCGPRLDMTTTNAIIALEAGNSHSHLIIPVRVDGFAIAGVGQTVDMINRTAIERRTQPQPWRILKTMVEPRTSAYKLGVKELKSALPDAEYFNTQISKSTVVPESSLAMEPLVSYDPGCKPAIEYQILAQEIGALDE